MNLSQLLESVDGNDTGKPYCHIDVNGISTNSKMIQQNDLFVAINGHRYDGHDFILDAVKAGAAAIIGEKNIQLPTIPYIKAPNSRKALARLAKAFYRPPLENKIIIGVTGTNGKTTTCFMIRHILENAGISCSLFTSVQNIVNGEKSTSTQTTLDPLNLYKLLSESNDDVLIIEVSSHGIVQFRVEGIEFDYCLFTNLDHEHLDYHQNMDEYFYVKSKLFEQLKPSGKAIINACNQWGQKLIRSLRSGGQIIHAIGDKEYPLRIQKKETAAVFIKTEDKTLKLRPGILGIHNLYNAALAFWTARILHIDEREIIDSLHSFTGVPGRFELFHHKNEAVIVVDYAHTADAFFHCLNTARHYGAKRIFHVFGFRGNRDESKRQDMVDMSSRLSDDVILTLDDLNGIPFGDMVKQLHILNQYGKGVVIPDRTLAIDHAIRHAGKGDWVIITGKGTEKYQHTFSLPTTSDDETVRYICSK